jgi:hypothetical protein
VQAGQAVLHASFGDSRIVEAADRLTLTVLPSDPTAAPAAQARPNPVVCGPARLEPFGEGGVAAAGATGSDRLGQGALTADQSYDSPGPGPGRPQKRAGRYLLVTALVTAEGLGEAAQAPECSGFDGPKGNAQVRGDL